MTLKKFRVEDLNASHVLVEINTDVLGPEEFTSINTFWSDWEHRLERAGSHELAVVTLFARNFIQDAMAEGGADFNDRSPTDISIGAYWTEKLTSQEGWPAEGMRVYGAYVEVPGFDDMRTIEL